MFGTAYQRAVSLEWKRCDWIKGKTNRTTAESDIWFCCARFCTDREIFGGEECDASLALYKDFQKAKNRESGSNVKKNVHWQEICLVDRDKELPLQEQL